MRPVNDADVDDASVTITHAVTTAAGTDYPLTLAITDITATVTDTDEILVRITADDTTPLPDGTQDVTLTVRLATPATAPTGGLTVPITVDATSTATATTDYTPPPTSVTIAQGASSATATVDIKAAITAGDTIVLDIGTIPTDGYTAAPTNAGGRVTLTATDPPRPAAPANFRLQPGNTQVTLSWSAVSGATGYRLYHATSASELATATATATLSHDTLSYVHTALTNGTTYYYQLTAVNSGGEGLRTATQQIIPDIAGVTITQTSGTTAVTEGATAEEPGASDTYTVVLDTQPAGAVVIDVTNSGTTALTVDTNSTTTGVQTTPLTFTTSNWNTPQTVTVRPVNDIDTANASVTITHTIDTDATADTTYDTVTIGSVTVTVTDDGVVVSSTTEINDTTSNGPALSDGDDFGHSVAWLGDLDGAGGAAGVLAVGAYLDDGSGDERGAVHLLALNADGTVRSTTEINDTTTNGPALNNEDWFGVSVAWLGDLDGAGGAAGVLAVGANGDDGGGSDSDRRGAVHLLALNADSTVRSTTEINDTTTNGPALNNEDYFGISVAWLGDLDGAGGAAGVLAVGAYLDDAGDTNRGAVHLLALNADLTVRSTTEINDTTTNGPALNNGDSFGRSVAWLGDLDGAGGAAGVLAVGAYADDAGGSMTSNRGAVHLLSLNADGTVRSTTEINDTTTNGPALNNGDTFGTSVAWLGDLDGDSTGAAGVLAAGAHWEYGSGRGAVHLLALNADSTVRSTTEINNTTANGPALSSDDRFGSSVAWLGDLDGDSTGAAGVLAAGAHRDDAGGSMTSNRGAVHLLFLR